MNHRALRLRKETLTSLEDGTLRSVGGASHLCGLTDTCTHGPSLDVDCPTLPVYRCYSQEITCLVISEKLSCLTC